jgi:raffinose synthase
VSDPPDAHDFAVLRQLVLSDGAVLRADDVGRPTRDCLFADVSREPVLLKVFNYNRDCAVIGVFNANYHPNAADRNTLKATVSPLDAPALKGEDFAAFAHEGNRVWRCKRTGHESVTLAEGKWEIVSFAPLDRGVAVLGLANKLNSTGAVISKKWNKDGSYSAMLRDGGQFVAWTERPPRVVQCDGNLLAFKYEAASGRLAATLPAAGKQTVTLRW